MLGWNQNRKENIYNTSRKREGATALPRYNKNETNVRWQQNKGWTP
jgi:hypothetical protein